MKLLLKFIILSLFLIVILLFSCNKEKFQSTTSFSLKFTNNDKNDKIILKKNLFINYDENEINNIIDEYSSNTDPDKKKSNKNSEDSEDSDKSKKYDIPNSRKNNSRDITKNNLFINNKDKEYKNNLNIENELCIGGYCMNSNILSIIGGYRDAPQFYAKSQKKTNTTTQTMTPPKDSDKPIYYNHDNLIPMAQSVCINNKGKDAITDKTIDNKTCLNAAHFDMLNGSKGLRLYGGAMESPPDYGNWDSAKENKINKKEDYLMPYYIEYGKEGWGIDSTKTDLLYKKHDSCCSNNLILHDAGQNDYDKTKKLKKSCLNYAFKKDAEASVGYAKRKLPIYRTDVHSCSHNGLCNNEYITNALKTDGDMCASMRENDCKDICEFKDGKCKSKECSTQDDKTKCNSILKCTYDHNSDKCSDRKDEVIKQSSEKKSEYNISNDELPKNNPGQINEFEKELYNAPYMNFRITPSKNDEGNIIEDGSYFHGHEHVHKSNMDYPCIFRNKDDCYNKSVDNRCLYDTVSSESGCNKTDKKITKVCRNREYVNVKVNNESIWWDATSAKSGVNVYSKDHYDITIDSEEAISRNGSYTLKVYEGGLLRLEIKDGTRNWYSNIPFEKLKENSKKKLNKYYNEAVIDVLDGWCRTISSNDCDNDSSHDGDVAWEWG